MISDELIAQIQNMSLSEQAEILGLFKELEDAKKLDAARDKFLPFVKYLWPDFVEGPHHQMVADAFDAVLRGEKKRIIINMAPRHTKSEFASIFLPAFFLGLNPAKKIIQTSHTAELAVGFGRKVRNLIDREDYQRLFPNLSLSADSKAAGRWATSKGGEYFAMGVGGALAGKGADLLVIDDPHSEQDAILGESNPEVYNRVLEWYEGGPRQRLQPGGAIIVVMTRWSLRDLTGQLLKKQMAETTGDTWEIIELPAILPSGNPIWPQYWKLEELLRTKASIPVSKWNAQYQQQPVSEEGALIKREYWNDWEKGEKPKFDAIMQSWDTAFTTGTRSDYSACTTWGVFYDEKTKKNCLFLIDAVRGKWEFPDLKQKALELYREYRPSICLIEGRAAGQPLIYELRSIGIPIQEFTVGRGTRAASNDKIARVNSVTDIFASGNVYAPKIKSYAQEVIEECAAFPAGEHDDFVDTVVMAITRFRQGGWIGTSLDGEEFDGEHEHQESYEYY